MDDNDYLDLYAEDITETENLSKNDNIDDSFDLYDDILLLPKTDTILENDKYTKINAEIPEKDSLETDIPLDDNNKNDNTNVEINIEIRNHIDDSFNLYDDILFQPNTETVFENQKYTTINAKIPEKDPLANFDENCSPNVDKTISITTTDIPLDDNNRNDNTNVEINIEIRNHIQEKPQDHNITAAAYQLYVGNLTWGTTEEEIITAIRKIGVNDLSKLELFEHRKTGKSNKYCCISVGSEDSMKLCMEVLPKNEINEQNPVVYKVLSNNEINEQNPVVPTREPSNNFQKEFTDNFLSCGENKVDFGAHEKHSTQISLPNLNVPPPGYLHRDSQIMQRPPFQHESRPNRNIRCNMQSRSRSPIPYEAQNLHCGPPFSADQHRKHRKELEDIMEKNKYVSKMAISRAKTDAKEKNYKSAKETLTIAISLIKKSRVAHDVRCKLLISSLEDVLNDIMCNNYSTFSSRSNRRSRSRSCRRSRSRSCRRSRSRSSRRSRCDSRRRSNNNSNRRSSSSSYRRSGSSSYRKFSDRSHRRSSNYFHIRRSKSRENYRYCEQSYDRSRRTNERDYREFENHSRKRRRERDDERDDGKKTRRDTHSRERIHKKQK